MADPIEGNPAQPGQAPGTPPTPEQPAQPPAPGAPPTPQSPTPEEIDAWKQQAAQAAQLEANYKALQADYTRKTQALATLTGGPQPGATNDPFAAQIAALKAQGYDEKEITPIINSMRAIVEPLQHQILTGQVASANQGQVEASMAQIYSEMPDAFQDAEVFQAVRQELQAMALESARSGQPWNPQYAHDVAQNLAFQEHGRRTLLKKKVPPTATATATVPNFQSMLGMQPGFRPPATTPATTAAKTADQIALRAELDARVKKTA